MIKGELNMLRVLFGFLFISCLMLCCSFRNSNFNVETFLVNIFK